MPYETRTLVIGTAKKSLSVIGKSNAYFVGRKPVRAPCGGPTIRHGEGRDPRDVAHLSVAHTVTNGSGPAEARCHHAASRSNDYHETAAGTIWLQDVVLQAGAHERRRPRTRAGVRIRSGRRSTSASRPFRLHGTTESCMNGVRRALEFDSKCSPIVCQSGIFANRWRIKTPLTYCVSGVLFGCGGWI